jgi:hypothetical protein
MAIQRGAPACLVRLARNSTRGVRVHPDSADGGAAPTGLPGHPSRGPKTDHALPLHRTTRWGRPRLSSRLSRRCRVALAVMSPPHFRGARPGPGRRSTSSDAPLALTARPGPRPRWATRPPSTHACPRPQTAPSVVGASARQPSRTRSGQARGGGLTLWLCPPLEHRAFDHAAEDLEDIREPAGVAEWQERLAPARGPLPC